MAKLDKAQIVHTKEKLRAFLLTQTRLLDGLIAILMDEDRQLNAEDEKIRNTIVLMIQALGVSAHSILKLTQELDMGIKDCFGIARSISELAVNIAFIAASSSEVGLARV